MGKHLVESVSGIPSKLHAEPGTVFERHGELDAVKDAFLGRGGVCKSSSRDGNSGLRSSCSGEKDEIEIEIEKEKVGVACGEY
jgi:hypothetical protein